MTKYAIIVAGGSGTRMNSAIPKQFLLLNGRPLLFYTLESFHQFDSSLKIILVLPGEHFFSWKKLCTKYKFSLPHSIVAGGKQRFFSVKNALDSIHEKSIIAVHDGVRPLVSQDTIRRCFETALEKGNAIPVIPVPDSLREKKKKGSKTVNRKYYFIVQTPQCFDSEILKKAYHQKFREGFTDDASVVEKAGETIYLCEGDQGNIKITTPLDLCIAECLLGKKTKAKNQISINE